jgi:hypothetical protein
MGKELQERYKIDLLQFDSTGSTTPNISRYYDMYGYRRADFLISGRTLMTIASTGAQAMYTAQVYLATDCSGGGQTALSSATAIVGKSATVNITATAKCNELWLVWDTAEYKTTALSMTIGTAVFVSSSAASVAMAYACAGASLAATVASEGFITMFNSTVLNTSTVLTENWVALHPHSSVTKAADARVRIVRKNADSTHTLLFTQDATCTHVNFGMGFTAHIGVDTQHLPDGKRYIAIAVNSSDTEQPYSVTLLREAYGSVKEQTGINKSVSLNASTSK